MEVVGIVLGGIPLILWALENYRKALNPVKDYWRYESTLRTIENNIFVQKEQLNVTFQNIGLQEPSLAEVELHLRKRYPDKCDNFMDILGHMDGIVHKLMYKLCIDKEGKPKWEEVAPDRWQWEWRRVKRSFGRNERQSLIYELQHWNNALKNCFERQEIPSDEGGPSVRKLQAQFDQKQCDAIRENAGVIHRVLESGWGCACPEPHGGILHLQGHNDNGMASAVFTLGLSHKKAQNRQLYPTEEFWQKVLIRIDETAAPLESVSLAPPAVASNPPVVHSPSPSKRIGFSKLMGYGHTRIKSDSRSVISNYSDSSFQTSLTSGMTSPPTRSPTPPISGLCKLLQNCTTTTEYLGYFLHPNSSPTRRIQIHNTTAKSSLPKMIPIGSILSPSNQQISSQLTLSRKQRFGIAASAVWAVLFLCDSPWLSEKLDQDEIQFLLDDNGANTQGEPAGNTCVSHRFCRQATEPVSSVSTSAADQFRNSQIRNKTLFALGILLIELCFNRPFAELRRESQIYSQTQGGVGTQRETTSAIAVIEDYDAAEKLIDKVYLEAGNLYGYAVQRCLRCEFPGRDITKTFHFQQFRKNFYDGVVAPIQATFALIPTSCAGF